MNLLSTIFAVLATNCCLAMEYDCTFENGLCSFHNTGEMNWTRANEATPTGPTGPNVAHGGTFFVFTEMNGAAGKLFQLTLKPFAGMGVEFWYHMYGIGTGTLLLETSTTTATASGAFWTEKWSKTGEQQVRYKSYRKQSVFIKIKIARDFSNQELCLLLLWFYTPVSMCCIFLQHISSNMY
jgi:hypothetical protein